MSTTQTSAAPAERVALRSVVVLRPRGYLPGTGLLLGLGLLAVAGLRLAAGLGRPTAPGIAGTVLLGLAGWQLKRSNQPRLLAASRNVLRLEPLPGLSATTSVPSEVIPLTDIRVFKFWLRLRRYRLFAQYHLRLKLADGRVLHLADRPGPPPAELAGTVRLDAVARRLARRAKSGLQRQPLFYDTRLARWLLWVSWGALAGAALLLWQGSASGVLLLFPAAGYWTSYYLGDRAADLPL